jgi:NAD(P)-dependent dehydrogenase (short-subunit alcohol dehydrogenase family)
MNGRVAIITGASRGLGAAVARAFSAQGAKVGLLSRSGDDLGLPDALGVRCDVRDRAQVRAGVAAVVERFGALHCAVANAGIGTYGPFMEMDPEAIDDMIDVNLKGTIHLAHATLPHLVAAGGGDFVSVASVAGLRAFPGEAGYNASKFGQLGFTRALDHELREQGVRCTSVCPGGIATEFAMGSGRTEESIEGMMSADEAAEAVVFCVTRPAGYRMLTVSYRPMNEGSWG